MEGKVSEKNEGSGMSEREKPSRMVVSSGRGGALEWAACLIFAGKLMVKRVVRGVYSGGVVRELTSEPIFGMTVIHRTIMGQTEAL